MHIVLRATLASVCMALAISSCTTAIPIIRKPEMYWGGVPLSAAELTASITKSLHAANPPIPIQSSRDGEISTDWLPVPGKTTGVLLWKREWQAQAKHTITVRPSFGDPTNRSEVSVATEVRERPNNNYPWEPADDSWLGEVSLKTLESLIFMSVYGVPK
jgi:hypothetical protein